MTSITVLARRLLWLAAIGLAGGAVYQWWNGRQAPTRPAAPEWPPIETDTAPAPPEAEPADEPEPVAVETEPEPEAEPEEPPVDAPEPEADAPSTDTSEASTDGAGWVSPDDDGSCPLSHPIKANDNSGIFHVPGGRFYDRTKAERCYADADAASADGYRRAKS